MFCLVYSSKANYKLELNEIKSLLKKARTFNAKNKITGCLFSYNGRFLQYIEGSQDTILELYHTIVADKRHSKVNLLAYDFILERVFQDWEMYYEDFENKNERLEYLEMLLTLFAENPRTSVSSNRTSVTFWNMVKKILVLESAS